jgi:hypothetical protein
MQSQGRKLKEERLQGKKNKERNKWELRLVINYNYYCPLIMYPF